MALGEVAMQRSTPQHCAALKDCCAPASPPEGSKRGPQQAQHTPIGVLRCCALASRLTFEVLR